jgi:hypothetical protein
MVFIRCNTRKFMLSSIFYRDDWRREKCFDFQSGCTWLESWLTWLRTFVSFLSFSRLIMGNNQGPNPSKLWCLSYSRLCFRLQFNEMNPLHSREYPKWPKNNSAINTFVIGNLTAVVMNSSILCSITQCSLLKVNQRFEGTFRLHFQGRKISQARNQEDADNKQSSCVKCMEYYISYPYMFLWRGA